MLGRITGKVTTLQFSFELKAGADARKFEYVKVLHRVYSWVLCQVVEIEASQEHTLVKCNVIGYKEKGRVRQVRIPLDVGTEVFVADDDFIRDIIQLDEHGAAIGRLDGKLIPVDLDLAKLLTKHVAVLAKSGAGKSYAVGVLLEEILERKVPVVIIDPHGEYHGLGKEAEEEEAMVRFGVKPKAYDVREYGSASLGLRPLRLPATVSREDLVHLLPKLNNTQLGILYSASKGMDQVTIDSLLPGLEAEESSAKWSIISLVEHLRSLDIFSSSPVAYNELVHSGSASVINLRGYPPEIQQVIVYKLAKDLFELRKQNRVAPFFLVVEEAHNYCPERSFGEATSSKILRTIASEGRKFGLGLCVISQRPARVDKSVLSQCTTQIILKVTNPNDLRAIGTSVEGLTSESEAEIQNLPVGTALVTGIVDMPLFVNIRPRRTRHGGHAVEMLDTDRSFDDQQQEFEEQELLPILRPNTSLEDRKLMADQTTESRTVLVSGYLFSCKEGEHHYSLLMDMTNGEIVVDLEEYRTARLPETERLSQVQIKILQAAHALRNFTPEQAAAKMGTMNTEDDFSTLVELGYLSKEDGGYMLTERYLLAKLSKHACYAKPAFERLPHDERLEAALGLDEAKAQLSRFTKVLDEQECNIVRYELR